MSLRAKLQALALEALRKDRSFRAPFHPGAFPRERRERRARRALKGRRCKQLGNSAHYFTPTLVRPRFPPPHPSEPPRHTKSPEALYSPTGGPR